MNILLTDPVYTTFYPFGGMGGFAVGAQKASIRMFGREGRAKVICALMQRDFEGFALQSGDTPVWIAPDESWGGEQEMHDAE